MEQILRFSTKVSAFSFDFLNKKATWLHLAAICTVIQSLALCFGIILMPEYTGAIAMVSLAVLLSPWIFLRLTNSVKSEELSVAIILIGFGMLAYPVITVISSLTEIDMATYLIGIGTFNVLAITGWLYINHKTET